MPTVQLTITELDIPYVPTSSPKMLYGLKINEHTLEDKHVSIENVIDYLGITELTYVVGFDTKLSESAKPHYHIHWADTRTLEALRKHKGRTLKAYGTDCKLYPAKKIEGSDFYVWYGYAVKEEIKITSHDIDINRLKIEAAIQNKIKKDKLKYEDKKAFKKAQQQTYEDQLYELLDQHYEDVVYDYNGTHSFIWWADKIYSFTLQHFDRHLTKSPLEIYTWKYLLKRKKADTGIYIQWCFPNR